MPHSPGSDRFTLIFTVIDEADRADLADDDDLRRRSGIPGDCLTSAAAVGATPASPVPQETSPAFQNQVTNHLYGMPMNTDGIAETLGAFPPLSSALGERGREVRALRGAGTDHPDSVLESLATGILRAEGATGAWDVTVALVSEARLKHLHAEFMGIDTATDIMTFPTEAGPGVARGGDLVISIDHVQDWSSETGSAPDDELRFLMAHGLLHLLGWRDETDRERQSMLARQHEVIDTWKKEWFDTTGHLIRIPGDHCRNHGLLEPDSPSPGPTSDKER